MVEPGPSPALQDALSALRLLNLAQARHWLDVALGQDFDNQRTLTLLKYVKYWQERLAKAGRQSSDLEQARYLLGQWSAFRAFTERVGGKAEDLIHGVRYFVYGHALKLLETYNTPEGANDPDILCLAGLCHKVLGNYETARRFCEAAFRHDRTNARVLAELADVCALLGDDEMAKLMFKEAFFLDPGDILIDSLESGLICRVIESTQAEIAEPALVAFWVPIFGLLAGVFNLSRDLRPAEYGKLRQSVYELERSWQEDARKRDALLPRLLNHYFWLLDYVKQVQQPAHVQEELLLKIESLHPGVFKLYTR